MKHQLDQKEETEDVLDMDVLDVIEDETRRGADPRLDEMIAQGLRVFIIGDRMRVDRSLKRTRITLR